MPDRAISAALPWAACFPQRRAVIHFVAAARVVIEQARPCSQQAVAIPAKAVSVGPSHRVRREASTAQLNIALSQDLVFRASSNGATGAVFHSARPDHASKSKRPPARVSTLTTAWRVDEVLASLVIMEFMRLFGHSCAVATY
jgi:hypothetical protein